MQSYRDPSQVIRVAKDETFTIELEGNPTTGYTWQPDFVCGCLELLGHEYRVIGPRLGSGGHERFRFRADEPGLAEIRFAYRRPWEGSARDTKRFRVVVEAVT